MGEPALGTPTYCLYVQCSFVFIPTHGGQILGSDFNPGLPTHDVLVGIPGVVVDVTRPATPGPKLPLCVQLGEAVVQPLGVVWPWESVTVIEY